MTFVLGAEKPAAIPKPRYSVQYVGQFTFVTDNQSNVLYAYENTAKGSELRLSLDLTQTGKAEMICVKQR